MTAIKTEIRRGAYYDSVVLMQLQAALANLPDIQNVGVVMGTSANKGLLAQSDLLTPEAQTALPDDLIIVVSGEAEAAASALSQVDELLATRKSVVDGIEYLPQSLEAAAKMLPEAGWVLISTPGRYAAGVARESLRLGKHVFLYSDNVSLEDEIALKRDAAQQGLLVMGPDCGTALVNGAGLGFANRVRRGPIGLVGASGTGLQHVTARIHQWGGGITHALGTGGRDLSEQVGAITTRQSLDLLRRDPETRVIVLISKPPAATVADNLLRLARTCGKPVIVNFIGYSASHPVGDSASHPGGDTPPADLAHENLHFAATLDGAAELAVRLAEHLQTSKVSKTFEVSAMPSFAAGQRYLRGLFSGGTLAYEALLILQDYLPAVYSNTPLNKQYKLTDSLVSRQHTLIDLGEDEFTVGRLHPMMDNSLRLQRLRQEADDPEVAVIMLDVVLGYGAHPNPAGELAPAMAQIQEKAREAGRHLEIVALVVGTDEDPQNMAEQIEQLQQAGARVETNHEVTVRYVGQLLQSLNPAAGLPPVDLAALRQPLAAINVGLMSFTESLTDQQVPIIHVNWKPPAGGNEKLMGILERMKKK
jgi:FdrA protein